MSRALRPYQWLHVATHRGRRHYHGIAASEEDVGDERMPLHVPLQHVVAGGFESLLGPNGCELSPSKTVSAVSVAILALRDMLAFRRAHVRLSDTYLGREEQDCFAILVLQALDRVAVEPRHVLFLLASRVRIHSFAYELGDRAHVDLGDSWLLHLRDDLL